MTKKFWLKGSVNFFYSKNGETEKMSIFRIHLNKLTRKEEFLIFF